ncbi:F-box protein At3g07870-like [Papaver somniferum]|uniref:F-box protein At3g07870-like n=1 Tax=Papaver somniferum TaxID=3469 RepID=UPI000E6F4878|nr:F-box protein At3g07870-like [Papaver somniferum]
MHLNHFNDLDSAHGKLSFLLGRRFYDEQHPLCYTEYDENLNCFTRTTRINLRPPFDNLHFLGSCNGVLCFLAYLDICSMQPAYICNFITREYTILPKYEGYGFLNGFGYIPSTNEYKIVRICKDEGDPNYGIVQVYTLGSVIVCRNGKKMDYDDLMSFDQPGEFANGAIHWVNYKETIVAFDLIDEDFRQLPSPPCNMQLFVMLHVVSGFLCACYRHSEGSDIWVLKKNESNHDVIWSKEFSNINGKPIIFTNTGGLLCFVYRDRKVYLYASKASSSKILVNEEQNFEIGVPHKNTLVSLKALGETDTKLMDTAEIESYSEETENNDH